MYSHRYLESTLVKQKAKLTGCRYFFPFFFPLPPVAALRQCLAFSTETTLPLSSHSKKSSERSTAGSNIIRMSGAQGSVSLFIALANVA